MGEHFSCLTVLNKLRLKLLRHLTTQVSSFDPNCKALLDSPISRDSRESDFLVFYQGKWGILEVDGDEFHPPSRTVDDHKRDRFFKASGIRIGAYFDAVQCFNQPDSIVQEFLKILYSVLVLNSHPSTLNV